MKILFATSEAAPFAKTGGLGDVAGTLPSELNAQGADVRVIMPLYNCIAQEYKDKMTYINHIYIDMAWRKQYCGVFELDHNGAKYYFIDNKFYFGGNHPYSYIHEDIEKFVFFSKAVLSILPTIDFRPDLINCNDWQTGSIPVFLDIFQDNPFFRGIKTVMTIHNLKFQGRWGLKGVQDVMGISDYYFTNDKLEYYKDANLLKGGIVYADKVSTVSESYAHEITTPEYGEGLNGLLYARRNDLIGIVNGISYTEYNPETDPMIYENYNKDNIFAKKAENKRRLQEELNLPQAPDKFMIGIVSRLTDQKGFDILAQVLEEICQSDIQIVVLGTGDEHFENMFRHFAWKYPEKISANIYFSNDLAHKIYAGCDAFLMPSRFEPCGLSQLISMRYGTIPIVRETGGLKDTVIPYNEYDGVGTGFSFKQYSSQDMLHVIRYAHSIYCNTNAWNGIIKNALDVDYSWNVSAQKYIKMYRDLIGIPDNIANDGSEIVEQAPVEEKQVEEQPVAEKPKRTRKAKTDKKSETVKKTEKKSTKKATSKAKKSEDKPAEQTVLPIEEIKSDVLNTVAVKADEPKADANIAKAAESDTVAAVVTAPEVKPDKKTKTKSASAKKSTKSTKKKTEEKESKTEIKSEEKTQNK